MNIAVILIIVLIFINFLALFGFITKYNLYEQCLNKEHLGCPVYTCGQAGSSLYTSIPECKDAAFRIDSNGQYYCSGGSLNGQSLGSDLPSC